MQPRPNSQKLIALCSFTAGGGFVRMWSVYEEDGRRVRERLQLKQAMEDVTVVDGLALAHAKLLGRANILTHEHLKVVKTELLETAGLDEDAIEVIRAWRAEEGVNDDEETELDGLALIDGLNSTNAKKLEAAGLDTLEKLKAAPTEALEGLKLSKAALEAVIAWREQQAEAQTADKRETK